MRTTEDFVAFSRGNVEAFVKSGQIWAAGLQEMGRQFAAQSQAQAQAAASTFRQVSTAKSVREALDLQTSYARAAVEQAVAQTGKTAEASLKLAEQAFAPIGSRVAVAMQGFRKIA